MSLKPPLPPNASFASAAGGPARVVNAGNLGASYTFALENDPNVWLVGTLNQNCTITVTGMTPGALGLILVTQDGTGGRTLTVNGTSVWTGGAANQTVTVVAACEDDETLSVSLAGAQGIQGVPGTALGVLGVDVWASQANPEAVTDWGPIIQGLIDGGDRHLLFREETFPFSTAIEVESVVGMLWQGSNHVNCKLVWTGGAGTGVECGQLDSKAAISFAASRVTLMDMFIGHEGGNGFDGDVMAFDLGVDAGFGQCGLCHVIRCAGVSDTDDATPTARSWIRNANAINGTIEECSIVAAVNGIIGPEQYPNANADNLTIRQNMFGSISNACIANIGRAWLIDGNIFQGGVGFLCPTPHFIYGDVAMYCTFTLRNNRYWDFDHADLRLIRQPSNQTWQFEAHGEKFFGSTPYPHFVLEGPGAVEITGIYTQDNLYANTDQSAIIDLGDSATAKKHRVWIVGNHWQTTQSGTDESYAVARVTGHKNVTIRGNSDDGTVGDNHRSYETITGQERLGYNGHVYTVSALATNVGDIQLFGNERAGILIVHLSNPGVAAGICGTVTLSNAIPRDGSTTGLTTNNRQMAVMLTPMEIGDPTSDGSLAAGAGVYVKVAAGADQAFSVYTKNGMAVGGNVRAAFAYRIVQL